MAAAAAAAALTSLLLAAGALLVLFERRARSLREGARKPQGASRFRDVLQLALQSGVMSVEYSTT